MPISLNRPLTSVEFKPHLYTEALGSLLTYELVRITGGAGLCAKRPGNRRGRTFEAHWFGSAELREVALPTPQGKEMADGLARHMQPQAAFASWH
jgi:hypothetical protein